MKKILVVLLLLATTIEAEEPAKKAKSEVDAMMEMYIETAKPVAEHQRLAELTGPWKVTTSLWFSPDGEAHVSSGTGSGRMILGGRFLVIESDLKGSFGAESMTIIGFDRRTNEYTMTGIDTLATYSIAAAGKYDAAQKGVVLHGSYAQPPSGQQQQYRFVWTTPSPREHLFTLYFLMDGKDVRVAVTRYSRE